MRPDLLSTVPPLSQYKSLEGAVLVVCFVDTVHQAAFGLLGVRDVLVGKEGFEFVGFAGAWGDEDDGIAGERHSRGAVVVVV